MTGVEVDIAIRARPVLAFIRYEFLALLGGAHKACDMPNDVNARETE